MPEEFCRHRTPGGDGRERRKEERLKRRADEAIGGAAAGVERLGVEETAAALEEDGRIAALVEGVRGAEDREENRRRMSSRGRRRGAGL